MCTCVRARVSEFVLTMYWVLCFVMGYVLQFGERAHKTKPIYIYSLSYSSALRNQGFGGHLTSIYIPLVTRDLAVTLS